MKYRNEKILIFSLAALWLLPFGLAPFLDRETDFAKTENRNRARWPREFRWRLFPGEVELFYNDRIPFRAIMLNFVRTVNAGLLAQNERRIIIGKDSFLFYQIPGSVECPFRQYSDDPAYRLREYDVRRICRHFAAVHADARRHNAQFLLVIPPSKINVYPDKLPLKRDYPRGKTLTDRVCGMLARECPQVAFLDLEPVLKDSRKKTSTLLYFPQDTHWNYFGAYFAVKSILDKLNAPWPKNWPLPDPSLRSRQENGKENGLCAAMHGNLPMMQTPLPSCGEENPFPKEFPRHDFRSDFRKGTILDNVFFTENAAAPDPRSVVVFRDSFTVALQPFLSSYFRKVCYYHSYLSGYPSSAVIAMHKPDLVIVECLARCLVFHRKK